MYLSDRIQLAVDSLADNTRRTLLSLLGITIGIAAVITVGTVSRSANGVVYAELESFGLTSVWINRNYQSEDADRRSRPGSGISSTNYKNLQTTCCPNVVDMSAMVWSQNRNVVQRGNQTSNANVTGVDRTHILVANDSISAGRFFRQIDIDEKRRVAVLAPKPRSDLFANSSTVIGQRIRINGAYFTVIGFLKEKSRDFLSSIGSVDNDVNRRILIPYTTFQSQLNTRDVNLIQIKATSLSNSDQAGKEVVARLRRATQKRFDYRTETMSSYIDTANRILGTVEMVGIIAASISLFVGGMGIANIMSTAVVERTREIGLRKAIGARGVDIRLHFLFESMIIAVIGGVLGTLLGLSLVTLASAVTGIKLIDTLPITLAALCSAMLVGLGAGYLPARRAARLDPVTALRYE